MSLLTRKQLSDLQNCEYMYDVVNFLTQHGFKIYETITLSETQKLEHFAKILGDYSLEQIEKVLPKK